MKRNWEALSNLTFKFECYRKNFDLVNEDDNFITECEGTIAEVRINERKRPFIVGEFGFSIWNIALGKKFGVDFNKLIKEYSGENSYDELNIEIKKNDFDIYKYKKIVFVHNFLLHKDYRKRGVSEELTEMLYRDYYDEDTTIFMLVLPFQYNIVDADYLLKEKTMHLTETKYSPEIVVSGKEYYSLEKILECEDRETNEYKLFAIAKRCGFDRLAESYLFQLQPEKTLKRMSEKHKYYKELEEKK